MGKIIHLLWSQMLLRMQKLGSRLGALESAQGRWIHLSWGSHYLAQRHLVLHIFRMGVNIGRHPTRNTASTTSTAVGQPLLVWSHPLVESVLFQSGDLVLLLLGLQLRLFGDVVNGKSLFAVGWGESSHCLIVRALELRLFDLTHYLLVVHLAELVVFSRSRSRHVRGKDSDIFEPARIHSVPGDLSLMELLLSLDCAVRIDAWLHGH